MAYSFIQDVPIGASEYREIVERLGEDPAPGLITHLCIELPQGGLRYIDVWESEAAWDRFAEERLHPVVHPFLMEKLGFTPGEPPRESVNVIDVWKGAAEARLVAAGS